MTKRNERITNEDLLLKEYPFLRAHIQSGWSYRIRVQKIDLDLLKLAGRKVVDADDFGTKTTMHAYLVLGLDGQKLASSAPVMKEVVKRFLLWQRKKTVTESGPRIVHMLESLSEEDYRSARFILEVVTPFAANATTSPELFTELIIHRTSEQLPVTAHIDRLVEGRRKELLEIEVEA